MMSRKKSCEPFSAPKQLSKRPSYSEKTHVALTPLSSHLPENAQKAKYETTFMHRRKSKCSWALEAHYYKNKAFSRDFAEHGSTK